MICSELILEKDDDMIGSSPFYRERVDAAVPASLVRRKDRLSSALLLHSENWLSTV